MENKENYNVILTDLDDLFITSSFYNNLTSANVITIDDINNLVLSTNYCIDTLSAICTDLFCLLISNAQNYYIEITDGVFPRVKYYNNRAGSISAVFPQSEINDIPLSSNQSIDLLTYNKDAVVQSINGAGGDIVGIELIQINGKTYSYNRHNKGRINLGTFKSFDREIIQTINGETGNITAPVGISVANTRYPCDENGVVDLNNISKLDPYITLKRNRNKKFFISLLVNTVNENNPSSVINKGYIKSKQNDLQVCSTAIEVTLVIEDDPDYPDYYTINVPLITDNRFVSYIYGLQNNIYKRIEQFDISNQGNAEYEVDLYKYGVPLTFVILEGDMNTTFNLRLTPNGSPNPVTLQYSKKYLPYRNFDMVTGVNFKIGEPVSLTGANTVFSLDINNYYHVTWLSGTGDVATTPCNPKYVCYGNIMSLVNWDTEIRNDYQFTTLFADTNIVKTPQLLATELTLGCYSKMFSGCAQLIVPPQLPATTMKDLCYFCMFNDCSSLSTVPNLPAMNLAPSCYYAMFWGCESLTIVPYYLLPAIELKPWCYASMFGGCTHLTDGPLLPAQLPPYITDEEDNDENTKYGKCDPNYTNCYGNMFYRSPALTAVHVNCIPERLIQHCAPPNIEYPNNDGVLQEDAAKAWMADYKDNNDGAAWLIEHNYCNEWLHNWIPEGEEGHKVEGDPSTYHEPITLYNTALWNEVKGTGIEKFYYDYTPWSFNFYWTRKVARSLEDTPLSFELISGVTDGAFCFRALQYNLGTNVISKYSFPTNEREYVTGGVNYEGMNVKYKYYNPSTKEISGAVNSRDANGWITQSWDESMNDGGYTLCHNKYPFNNTTSGKNGLIISLSCNYFSKGLDSTNNRVLFWRLCHQNGCKFKVMGNLNSLNGFHDNLQPYEFFSLFSDMQHGNKHHGYGFIDAHQMILPFKNLADHCYERMFEGVSGLINGPTQLPATILKTNCYSNMFSKCNKMEIGRNINATNLNTRSCDWMFQGCSSLVTAPSISVFTDGANSGLKAMFYNCSKLKSCQDIVITTICTKQCSEMFMNCTELLYPPSIIAKNVEPSGCAWMFSTCRDLLYIPPLPATSLAEHCYHRMFRYGETDNYNMKNLTSKYVYLPATDNGMGDYCYREMFYATDVDYIVVKFTDWMNRERWPDLVIDPTGHTLETRLYTKTNGWLGVLNTLRDTQGTFCCSPNLSITLRDSHHIPTNWTVLNGVKTAKLVFSDSIQVGSLELYYLNKNI